MASLKSIAASMGTGALVASGLWLLVLTGECAAWRKQAKTEKLPIRVVQTERFKDYPTVKVPLDLELPVIPKKDREKLADKYRRPELAGESILGGLGNPTILGEYSLPPLPSGGSALVLALPDGSVSVDVSPAPTKFFSFDSSWRVRAGVGIDSYGQEIVGVVVGWTGPRTGRVSYGFDSYLVSGRNGGTGAVLLTIGF